MIRRPIFLLALLLATACTPNPAATSAELTASLSSASPGDVVEVAAGRFSGTFQVPAGVTLQGAGSSTVFEGSAGNLLAVNTTPGSTSVVANVRVESSGAAGIAVYGTGAASITDVEVVFTLGVGVAVEAIPSLTIERVSITGAVTSANAGTQPMEPGPADSSSHGLVIVDVPSARLTDVSASGAALFGALIINSGITWTGGGVDQNLATGLMIYGGSASLNSIEVAGTLQGFRLPPVFGAVFMNDALVDSTAISVTANDGIGMVHVGTTAMHLDLTATANTNAALWLQDSTGVTVEGATRFTDNEFASIVAIDTTDLTIDGAVIENTVSATRTVGLTGRVEVGDGIQLVRPTNALLQDLTLASNERTGVLLELGAGSTSQVTLASISVMGTGTELGVVAQEGTLEMGWDDGVTRDGVIAVNDTAFITAGITLDIVEVVTPTDLPQVDAIAASGLSLVGVVTPTD